MTLAETVTESGVTHAQLANAIRALSMDAVQAANSGHPGMPMGMADIATVLFTRYLKFDPSTPDWPDRDRFILSNGHGSMLLYSALYLTGYADMDIEQIRNFRQLGSRTAGHPEFGHASGVETTTGPLGQGLANAVGMALAERMMADRFGSDVVDHFTYVFAGDGCLMEGISHEAASLAGHLKLNRLIVLFDDNDISIDGSTDLTVRDDQIGRFSAYGWDTCRIDGHDPEAIAAAIENAKASDTPSLIACRTVIGYGAPNKQGTAATHGAALGSDEVAAARQQLEWPHDPFELPEDILAVWRDAGSRGIKQRLDWQKRLDGLAPDLRSRYEAALSRDVPAGMEPAIDEFRKNLVAEQPKLATRQASQKTLEVLDDAVPNLAGGSADLTGSNLTKTGGMSAVTAGDYRGSYIYYGVREHAMASAMNGLALHGGFIPYGGTFLIFTDYCRPAIRLAALMCQRVIYVMTHDSIGLGEDGPTHQPVEHLASLRAIPNLNVFRPADAVETAECWALAVKSADTPSLLALTRQGVPTLRTVYTDDHPCAKGAYVLRDSDGERQVTLLATGSEVAIACDAREILQSEGVGTAVVSMPCHELFDQQDQAYQEAVLGAGVRIAVEAAVQQGWERYIGPGGGFVGMSGFGASAPGAALYNHFGITAEAVAGAARQRLSPASNRRENSMAIRVAINGFGRIGRLVLRAALESKRDDIEFVAVNDLGSAEANAHLLKYDSVHGVFPGEVSAGDDWMDFGQGRIKVTAERDPSKLPWKELGVDIAFECTGIFTKREQAAMHLEAGAKRVLVSAPASGADLTVVYGVNHEQLDPSHTVVSNASCTTNCLAPVAHVLNQAIGIERGFMTTIHAFTGDQRTVDTLHPDLRRARAASQSLIPTSTGAAKAVGLVLPEMEGKLDGTAIRVPTANVSLIDLKFDASRATDVEEVNGAIKQAAGGALKGVLETNEAPLVSVDFNHNPASSTFDLTQTQVINDTLVRVLSWYDNEWGFSNRMSDTAVAMGKLG